MRIRSAFWGIITALVVAVIGLAWTGSDAFKRLIFFCIITILISLFWAWFSIRKFKITRYSRGLRQKLGDVFEERFEITNLMNIGRSWLEIIDHSDLPGSSGSRVLSGLVKHEQRSYSSYTLLYKRGLFPLGPTTLKSSDPFGLFSREKSYPYSQSLLVLPYIVDISNFPSPPGFLPGGKAQQYRTSEVTPHAAGVREYIPGDTLNRIHWPSSAKKGKLMVKEYERDPQADIWIFIDADRSIQESLAYKFPIAKADQLFFQKGKSQIDFPPDTFEYEVSVAASVAKYFIRSGKAVGFGVNTKNAIIFQPERGERQFGKIIEMLAYITPDGRKSMATFFEGRLAAIPRGSSAVIVTCATDDSFVRLANSLLIREINPIFILINPATMGGDQSNRELSDQLRSMNIMVGDISHNEDLKLAIESCFFNDLSKGNQIVDQFWRQN